MAAAFRERFPEAEVIVIPLADGGEGTLDVLSRALDAEIRFARVSDPLGREISARYGVAGDTGIIEVAEACGLSLLSPDERNPLVASSRGVGELIIKVYAAGCRHLLIGLGGSATCDGGAGMLSVQGIKEVLKDVSIELLCDVTSPFVGPDGAARVFAPQKGASPEDVEVLESRLCALAEKYSKETGIDISDAPGAGAAGGLGGALMAYSGARVVSGIDRILDLVGFDAAVAGADLVVTGEGRSDAQTLRGKVPIGVLRRSRAVSVGVLRCSGVVPVALVSGAIDTNCPELRDAGFAAMIQVSTPGHPEDLLPRNALKNITAGVHRLHTTGLVHGLKKKNGIIMSETFIETPRMRFRIWKEEDAPVLFKYASDPEVGPRAGWPPHKSVEESLEIIRSVFSNGHTWALELKETGEPIGCIGYFDSKESNIGIGENDAELGYWIARPYWNQGLCTEALQAMVNWCLGDGGFDTLWSDFFIDNPASGRVMEKCGFRDTGEVNYLSKLQLGSDRPVKVMKLDS